MMSRNALLGRTLPLLTQFAGAHRKPRWVPVAKSKVYRIPKRPVVSEEEKVELLRVHNNYKTQMRAVRRFFHEEMIRERSSLQSASSEMSLKLEAEEWERAVKLNAEWNKKVAAEREERRKQELAAMEEYALKRMGDKDQSLHKRIQEASQQIRKEKELSSTFITPENLDEAIEHALANPTDYNFAIDLKGNQFQGRETPIKPPEDQKVKNAAV